ncbi:hypothetical protein GW932_03830 [archaeon]|nr:hypothetical protein [archaeon]
MSEEKTINERILYCIGSAAVEKDLDLGQDVTITVKGNVLKIEQRDNQDGTRDLLFKVKLITVEKLDAERVAE